MGAITALAGGIAVRFDSMLVAGETSVTAEQSSATATNSHVKPVMLPSVTGESMVGIRLDRDVYLSSTPHFADLRVLDNFEQEVPYVLRKLVSGVIVVLLVLLGAVLRQAAQRLDKIPRS